MKFALKFICLLICANLCLNELFCPIKKELPEETQKDSSYTINSINPVKYLDQDYTAVQVANKIFLNKSKGKFTWSSSALYEDSDYCPDDFVIPKKEDFESVLNILGADAYSVLTDPNGFNMEPKNYYVTNTKGSKTFTKYFMYLDGKTIKFIDTEPKDINGDLSQRAVSRCMLDLSKINLIFPDTKGDIEFNKDTRIKTSNEKYLNGFLWKIEGSTYTTKEITHKFDKSGMHMVEFWGNYINGELVYLCENVFVKKKSIESSQDFDESKNKIIETDFDMEYTSTLHFEHSNSPVSPRIDGGYYISFTDKNKFLHVLSYDRDDKLLKDFNTTEKAYPYDIASTDYGFAIYMKEAGSSYHSYLSVYNKNFDLINTVQIMNNAASDNKKVNSTLKKQIIRFDKFKNPVFGMNFMFEPDNGKLIYSRGRVFLIFCHYNYFLDKKEGHTGDTTVTFNDILTDMDFGDTWGSSHSLIQSATFDEFYFWTAALGDAYPKGINVEYTSKREFSNNYDPVHKKYNLRKVVEKDALAGYIKGYENGSADGKLGGILYFDKLGLYCLVYAKTPDVDNGKNMIYMTTWKFIDNQITDNKTHVIKEFESNNVMQVRAGRYGDDKVYIIYAETPYSGGNHYGYVTKGTTPKVYIIGLSSDPIQFIVTDESYDNLLMNTNEDLRTFEDGVLIWATSNKQGKLTINKIGTPRLKEDDDDIEYELTKEDLIEYLKTHEDITDDNLNKANIEEEKGDLSGGAIAGIVIGSIGGAGGIGVGVYFLLRYFKLKNIIPKSPEPITQAKGDITRFSNSRNNVNNKSSVNSRINVNRKSSVNNNSTIRNLGKGKGKVKMKRKSINK